MWANRALAIALTVMPAIIAFAGVTTEAAQRSADIATETADIQYRKAVEDARAGLVVQALSVLKPLVERFPERQDMLDDYAVVLGWRSDHAAALALLDRINRVSAPSYVLEGLAYSARELKRFDLAESLYTESTTRSADRLEPRIGLALTLTDEGELDDAVAAIEQLRAQHPLRIDVLEAVAYIDTANKDYFGALAAYQQILAQQPGQKDALLGNIQILSRLGAPQLAIELADRNPGVLPIEERDAIAGDRIGDHVRWGTIDANAGHGPERFASIDQAIDESETAGELAMNPGTELTAPERQVALDRISALHQRFRMRDVTILYEAMAARPEAMPAYTKSAAASAYLYLQHPKKARDLYREALVTDSANLESRIGLFYALGENEQHREALAELKLAAAATPQWIDAWSPATIRENPAYTGVLSLQAIAPLFAERPGEAERRLHRLLVQTPYSMAIRADYASSMRARGWPRAAEEELRWILVVNPYDSGALGERSGALLEMQDYRNAAVALAAARAVSVEDGRVMRAARMEQVHNMREFVVDSPFDKSSAVNPAGTRDYSVNTWLYSSPFDYRFRVFTHAYIAEAKLTYGVAERKRAGAGLEYRSKFVTSTVELSHNLTHGETGEAVAVAFTPNDHWTFRGAADTDSNETPLQAIIAGIHARLGSGEVLWQANESRGAALSYTELAFSDGNRRGTEAVHWTERVIAGPAYKLEVTGALYASRNSLTGVPYFNPSRDFSPSLEFANEWTQWRRYTWAFRHRVVLTTGTYWEQGFRTGPIYGVRYEQEWEAADRLTLRYGIGRSAHPYDGAKTLTSLGALSLNWRF